MIEDRNNLVIDINRWRLVSIQGRAKGVIFRVFTLLGEARDLKGSVLIRLQLDYAAADLHFLVAPFASIWKHRTRTQKPWPRLKILSKILSKIENRNYRYEKSLKLENRLAKRREKNFVKHSEIAMLNVIPPFGGPDNANAICHHMRMSL